VHEIARDSGEFLMMMINNVLDHSKLKANKMGVDVQPVKVKQLLHKISRMFQAQAKSKGLNLKVCVP
jgi:signal transduction histidine kinase